MLKFMLPKFTCHFTNDPVPVLRVRNAVVEGFHVKYSIISLPEDGPWGVYSGHQVVGPDDRESPPVGDGSWCIVNIETGDTKRIGKVKLRGTNYFDRAVEEAKRRNLKLKLKTKS